MSEQKVRPSTGVPPPRTNASAVLNFPADLLLDALGALVGADSGAGAAAACLPLLRAQPGVRACALVVRDGRQVVVVGSAGYDCGAMAAGVTIPLDAGLPVTEAVRTGRLVARGPGPSWLAVPFGPHRAGALLLSLTAAPPECPEDLARLHRLARALGEVLRRSAQQQEAVVAMGLVTAHLTGSGPGAAGYEIAARVLPHEGLVGGDLAMCELSVDGGLWLVVADVCGAGLSGALVARSVRTAVRAVAPYAADPQELLAGVERAIGSDIEPGSFVTAIAVQLRAGRLRAASTGHPAPLLLTAAGVAALAVEPGEPLALETGVSGPRRVVECCLPGDAVLLLHTDGLTDRHTAAGTRTVDPLELVPSDRPGDLEELADRVLADASRVGVAADDVSVLLVRVAAPSH